MLFLLVVVSVGWNLLTRKSIKTPAADLPPSISMPGTLPPCPPEAAPMSGPTHATVSSSPASIPSNVSGPGSKNPLKVVKRSRRFRSFWKKALNARRYFSPYGRRTAQSTVDTQNEAGPSSTTGGAMLPLGATIDISASVATMRPSSPESGSDTSTAVDSVTDVDTSPKRALAPVLDTSPAPSSSPEGAIAADTPAEQPQLPSAPSLLSATLAQPTTLQHLLNMREHLQLDHDQGMEKMREHHADFRRWKSCQYPTDIKAILERLQVQSGELNVLNRFLGEKIEENATLKVDLKAQANEIDALKRQVEMQAEAMRRLQHEVSSAQESTVDFLLENEELRAEVASLKNELEGLPAGSTRPLRIRRTRRS